MIACHAIENILKYEEIMKKYTKKQILESIKYWQKQLKKMKDESIDADTLDEAFKVSLADKKSATAALLKHNDEIYEFAEQKPRPSKDELVEFVANIFKEEGLDTPWTRQFLIRMKAYTHSFDDALQYLFYSRLKGEGLGMGVGRPGYGMSEDDDELCESEDKKLTQKEADNKKDAAKKEAAQIKTASDAKKFLKKHQSDIQKLGSKLKGDAKKDFGKIVSFIENYASNKTVDESSSDVLLKVVYGCIAVISFMCGLTSFGWIALSPIVGPLLHEAVKRLSKAE